MEVQKLEIPMGITPCIANKRLVGNRGEGDGRDATTWFYPSFATFSQSLRTISSPYMNPWKKII